MLEYYLHIYCNYKQDDWSNLLLIITFAYNNNVYLSIDCAFNELFRNYVADFANESESRFINKETFFVIERVDWLQSSKEYLRELWKKNCKKIEVKLWCTL